MATQAQGTPVPAVFNFQAHEVRTVLREGAVWFVAADVCAALGYLNTTKAVADHLDEDERSNEQLDRSRMGSKAVIISESGLYALVLRSRKPAARQFAKWVTSEVLPTIRKTGAYQSPEAARTPADALRDLFQAGTFLISHQNGNLVLNPVPHGYVVVNPRDAVDVSNLVTNYVPIDQLPNVIEGANNRLARYIKLASQSRTKERQVIE